MQKLITNLKLNSTSFLEFLVLKMLSTDRSYSIKEMADELKNLGFKTPMGSIYPLLTKLRRKKFVKTEYDESETGTRVKAYYLSSEGQDQLRALKSDWKRLNDLVASIGSR